jgi:predicted helicase
MEEAKIVREDMIILKPHDIQSKYDLPEDGRDWKVEWAKDDIVNRAAHIVRILYRPFDVRYTLYTGHTKGFIAYPRHKTMKHLIEKENICLLTSRMIPPNHKFDRVLCCKNSVDVHAASDQTYVFPLYTYNVDGETDPNLSPEIVKMIAERMGRKYKLSRPEEIFNHVSALDIFDYIYGVLHSPKYREKYEEFLKIDFPRIPYPKDTAEFERLAKWWQRLRELHLLEKIPKIKTTFPVADGNEVENIRYSPPVEGAGGGRVFINKTQYFGNVPVSVWEFFVGGYCPAQKWLKDRKGRSLSFEEIQHYKKIVTVLKETIDVMEEIDAFFANFA